MQNALDYAPTGSVTTTDTSSTGTFEITAVDETTTSKTSDTVPSVQENVLSSEICEQLM